MTDKNHAQTISELTVAAAYQPVKISAAQGREFVAVPLGNGAFKLEQITAPNAADVLLPKIVTQAPKLQTVASLIDYVNRFKNGDTVLFADIAHNSIDARIDYHKKPQTDNEPSARLNQHRAQLKLPYSQEWITWSAESGRLMSHVEFATFIEENSDDVITPVGGTLLEMCRDLQVKAGMSVKSSIRNGDTTDFEFQRADDVTTKENMQIPVQITLNIPVYFNEEKVNVNAFLRRRVIDGRLQLGYVMSRAENIRQFEFQRIVGEIQTAVDLTTVYGEI